jgi:hypothetical protein
MKWILRFAVLLLVCVPFALAERPSSAQVTPTVTITPNTLVDGGDVVTLAGTGFDANSTVYYCQGVVALPLDESNCGVQYSSVTADGTGAFSVPVTVFRFIMPANTGNTTIDCTQPSSNCGIGAANSVTGTGLVGAGAGISFTTQPPTNTFAIIGSVTGPNSQRVANANVSAYTPSDTWIGSLRTVTDTSGTYELGGTINPHVAYRIQFGRPAGTDLVPEWFNNQAHRTSAELIALPRAFNDPTVIANAQLAAGGAIAGTVTNSTGTGVAGVKVWGYGPGDTWLGSFATTTAADGSYRIGGVRPASYKVFFIPATGSGLANQWFDNASTRTSAKAVTVTAGSTAAGINATLR